MKKRKMSGAGVCVCVSSRTFKISKTEVTEMTNSNITYYFCEKRWFIIKITP